MWRKETTAAFGHVRHAELTVVNKMAHQVMVLGLRPKDLSSIQQLVLRPPHIWCHTHSHTNTDRQVIK